MKMNLRKKSLVILLGLFILTANAFATNKVHLVSVGIADYPGTANDLNLCAKDAETIKWLYEKNSNAVTEILTNSSATKEAILSAIRTTFKYSSTDDIVVFFFSGILLSYSQGFHIRALFSPQRK